MKWQVQYHGQAPVIIHLLIVIFNRIDPILGIFIYTVCVNKNNKFKYILLFLLIVRSLVRISIGIFVYIFLLFIIQNYRVIVSFIKKKFLIFVLFSSLLIIISPNIIMYIVNQKNVARSGMVRLEKLDIPMIVFGIMAGRISSFSESAIITERKPKLKALIKPKPNYEYLEEAMEFFNAKQHRLNVTRYNTILLHSQGEYHRHVGFMTSTYGALLIGLYKSYIALIINFLTISICVLGGFKIISLLHYDKTKEVVFIFFCYCVLSGIGNEFMMVLANIVLYSILFIIINFFMLNSFDKNKYV
jgi:hypothetical protein